MYDGLVRVAHQEELGAQTHLLTLDAPAIAQETQPGQFVMLQSAPRGGPLLRRPFSVQRVHDDGGIEILYKVVGVGTAAMAALVPGDRVTALGPLGHPFTMPSRSEHAVLLGGGVGIPPMVILSDHLRAAGHTAWTALLGLRSAMQRGAAVGHKGHVVSLLRTLRDTGRLDGPLRLYACGPMAMLRAVAVEAANLRVPCEVSVETMMGCGVGVCMGCVIESSAWVSAADRRAFSPYDRWWLACKRGPVFDAQQVVLDDGGLLH
jgi:dihydroorotate dehydrogenase electron transfer subunit